MAEEQTPDDEGTPRVSRPAVRLGRLPAPRRGGPPRRRGVGARAPGRVMRVGDAADRGAARGCRGGGDVSARAARRQRAATATACPGARTPRGDDGVGGGVDLRGRRRAGDRDVRGARRPRGRRGRARAEARAQPRRADRGRPGDRVRPSRRSTLPPRAGSRGGRTSAPAGPAPLPRRARQGRLRSLGPATPKPPSPSPRRRPRRSCAARRPSRRPSRSAPPKRRRRAARARADGAAAQAAAAAPTAPLRPRMQRAVRSEPVAATGRPPEAGAEIVHPAPGAQGAFRRVIDAMTGRRSGPPRARRTPRRCSRRRRVRSAHPPPSLAARSLAGLRPAHAAAAVAVGQRPALGGPSRGRPAVIRRRGAARR